MTDAPREPVNLRVAWVSNPSVVPQPVNQFFIQQGPSVGKTADGDLVYVHLGHVNPPLVQSGPGVDQQEALREFASNNLLPITELGSFVFSVERLREFLKIASDVLEKVQESND